MRKCITYFLIFISLSFGALGDGYGVTGNRWGYLNYGYNPYSSNPLQWLYLATSPATVTDRTINKLNADYVDSNCLDFDGATAVLVPELTGSETVTSFGGTSTPSISAGQINFTAGTCWDLVLSNGSHYPMASGGLVDVYDTSVNGYHGTLSGGTPATGLQSDYHRNTFSGHSKVLSFANNTAVGSATAISSGTKMITIGFRVTSLSVLQYILDFRMVSQTGNGYIYIDTSGNIVTPAGTIGTCSAGVWTEITTSLAVGTSPILIGNRFSINAAYGAQICCLSVADNGDWNTYSVVGSNLPDSSGNDNDAMIINANELRLPALDDDPFEDVGGLGLTNPPATGNQIHNNAEITIRQNGDIIVTGAGTTDCSGLYILITNPYTESLCWNKGIYYIFEDQGSWVVFDSNAEITLYVVVDASVVPPKTDWITALGLSPAPTLSYNSPSVFLDNLFWSADGATYDKKSFADMITHTNWNNYVVVNSASPSVISEILTWTQDTIIYLHFYRGMAKYILPNSNPTMEPEFDLDGSYQYNPDGSIELVQPE